MGKARATELISCSLAEAWDTLAGLATFSNWVDGFGKLVSDEGEWPAPGSVITWESAPRGRGTVREEVLDARQRERLEVEFADDAASGLVATALAIEGDGVRIEQQINYRLSDPGPFGIVADLLFVRGEQRRSLERSLGNLKALLERSPPEG